MPAGAGEMVSRVVIGDITERKHAQEALEASERKFRTLAENFPDIITRVDKQLRHLYVSPSIEKYTELSAEQFLGKTNHEHGIAAGNIEIWNDRVRQVIKNGEPEEFTFEFSRNSQCYVFESWLVPEFGQNGDIESVMSISRDVTKLKRAEERLELYTKELEDTNIALKVLLKQREHDEKESEDRFHNSIANLVMPYIDLLREKIGKLPDANTYLNIIESNLNVIMSLLSDAITLKLSRLTRAETVVASLVKDGKQDKEIAQTIDLSIHTVKAHRRNIRKKLDIPGKNGSLKSFLSPKLNDYNY